MKNESFFSLRIKPVLIMAVMTIVCIALVSGIHLSTQEMVIANEGLVLKKAVLYSAGIDVPETNTAINELYDQLVTEKDEGLFIISSSDGRPGSYAFTISGPGLWGEITAVTAFESGTEVFSGVDFISQNETPGLGARITETWFREQLRGKKAPLSMVPEGSPAGPSEIDAITGASRTSEYVLQIFNNAAERASGLVKEGM